MAPMPAPRRAMCLEGAFVSFPRLCVLPRFPRLKSLIVDERCHRQNWAFCEKKETAPKAPRMARIGYWMTTGVAAVSAQAVAMGVGGGLGTVGAVGFGKDACHMMGDGVERNDQLAGDLLVALARSKQSKHLDLTRAED